MTDLGRLDTLVRACVQAAHEVADTDTAGWFLKVRTGF